MGLYWGLVAWPARPLSGLRLRRPWHPVAEIGGRVRSGGHGSWMDLLVPDRSNAAGLLPWMPVINAVRTVRRAARVGAWPTAVCALHRRAGADRRAPRPTSTYVRRRLPGVPQHVR